MSTEKLLIKAKKLIKSNRIESLGNGKFNVIGDHGTYLVIKKYDGTVSCNCIGFLRRKRCSHSIAVLLNNSSSRKRKSR